MKALVLGNIDAVYLAQEMAEDEERRSRGMELVSFEVPEALFLELCEYMKKRKADSSLFQEILKEYMEAHPV